MKYSVLILSLFILLFSCQTMKESTPDYSLGLNIKSYGQYLLSIVYDFDSYGRLKSVVHYFKSEPYEEYYIEYESDDTFYLRSIKDKLEIDKVFWNITEGHTWSSDGQGPYNLTIKDSLVYIISTPFFRIENEPVFNLGLRYCLKKDKIILEISNNDRFLAIEEKDRISFMDKDKKPIWSIEFNGETKDFVIKNLKE